eukprot:CAMPEP_0183706664 /NCGR_PEP_ID=MMETSP0737-20130205/3429_1 /TAXON_ID=385413 /ORGANISM="Thalassiosira miniscula, Strain CCMP1093" /LENGTH=194 /DNA_ID=CAMNT_0025934129 /DNA_START=153 /DNA_END=737 /DNA_ORIENTATION=-
MKLFFLPSITLLVAVCNSEARLLRKGGDKLGRLQSMIETECGDGNSICDGVDTNALDCTFEKPPERPDMTDVDEDRKAQLKTEFRAKKEECRQKMLKCACCAGMSAEDILAAKREQGGKGGGGGGSRPYMGGGSGRPGMGYRPRPEGRADGIPEDGAEDGPTSSSDSLSSSDSGDGSTSSGDGSQEPGVVGGDP